MPTKRNAPTALTNRPASKRTTQTPKKRARKRKPSKLPTQDAVNAALVQFFGDATNAERAALSRAASRAARNARTESSAPPAAIDARLVASAARPPRVRIGEAMRRTGLDEYRVAETFAGVLETLTGKNAAKSGAVQKIVVDVLKECSRHLDPPQSERAASASPVIALIHNVPRPDRTPKPQPQAQLNAAPASPAVAPTIDAMPPDASPAIDVQSQIKEPS